MLSELAIGYLFLGGVGGGSLAVLSALEIANARGARIVVASRVGVGFRGSSARSPMPADALAWSWPLCLGLLALGVLCLLVDLGRPDRLFNLMTSPTLSAIAVGAWALVAAIVIAGAFSALALFDGVCIGMVATCVLSVAGVVVGATVAIYTGILLQSMASVLAWQTPLVPIVFVLSSASCGTAVAFLGAVFANTRQVYEHAIAALARADGAIIVAEAVALAAFVFWGLGSEGTREAALALAVGDLAWAFWGGVVIVGLVVPFVLELFTTFDNHRLQLLWVATAVLVGAFALRWCMAGLAAYDVTQMPEALFGLAVGSA
ncbi:MAG TPA: polysulfide reductase NrfD [Slackia equolifaciens]|uniref:Polysulfide reductase NrfD n=1 Tax=Slackia equolifaciens TaxID=498718 RepID=A0A9D3A164_9ACTN|nr:polysulfide reductase NrfD [Slackia equolifaciens]